LSFNNLSYNFSVFQSYSAALVQCHPERTKSSRISSAGHSEPSDEKNQDKAACEITPGLIAWWGWWTTPLYRYRFCNKFKKIVTTARWEAESAIKSWIIMWFQMAINHTVI